MDAPIFSADELNLEKYYRLAKKVSDKDTTDKDDTKKRQSLT